MTIFLDFLVGTLTAFLCHSLLLGTNLSAGRCAMAEATQSILLSCSATTIILIPQSASAVLDVLGP